MTAKQSQRFGLITPSGWGNLGDAAIQDAVICHLRRRIPNCDIITFSLNPEDTEKRHGVPSYPISGLSIIPGYWVRSEREPVVRQSDVARSQLSSTPQESDEHGLKAGLRKVPILFGVLRLARRILGPVEQFLRRRYSDLRHIARSVILCRGASALIVSGGGQIDDYWGGPWGHPYTLFKWALISRLTGSQYLFLGVGTCTLSSALSRFFVRRALSMADHRSYRDQTSLELARPIGAVDSDAVVPDLTFSLEVDRYLDGVASLDSRRVVVSPMCYCDPRIWPTKSAKIYGEYIEKLAAVCASLIRDGWQVVFVPSDTADNMAIKDCTVELKKEIGESAGAAAEAPAIDSVDDLLAAIAGARGVIASRLHGVLLSYALHKPVLSLSYDRKVRTLVTDMNQADFCYEIEEFSVSEVVSRFKRMVESSDDVTKEIEAMANGFRESLNKHFDTILKS